MIRSPKVAWWTDGIAVAICWLCAVMLIGSSVDAMALAEGQPSALWYVIGVIGGIFALNSRLRRRPRGKANQAWHFALLTAAALGLLATCTLPSAPGFLEALVRADVSKVKNAQRSFLEAVATNAAQPLPPDTFQTTASLHAERDSEGHWKVWSVGPDKIDDHAMLVYDSTNGTVSTGDIVAQK